MAYFPGVGVFFEQLFGRGKCFKNSNARGGCPGGGMLKLFDLTGTLHAEISAEVVTKWRRKRRITVGLQ